MRKTKLLFEKEHSHYTPLGSYHFQSMELTEDAYNALKASLLNESGKVPLHERFRALFTLKSLKNQRAVDIISQGAFLLPGHLGVLKGSVDRC